MIQRITRNILKKVKGRLINSIHDAMYMAGINKSFHLNTGRRILIYHGLCEKNHRKYNYSFITKANFEKQLQMHLQYFNLISLDDWYNGLFDEKRFNVSLSFDDGLENNFTVALPLLARYEVPAAFFITGISDAGYNILWNHFLDTVSKFGPRKILLGTVNYYKQSGKYVSDSTGLTLNEELRYDAFETKANMISQLNPYFEKAKKDHEYWIQMTSEKIRLLSQSRFATIGCHGYYHNDLARIPLTEAETEIVKCKQYLEGICNKAIDALAFPYGSYTPELVSVAKASGFNKLLAMELLYPGDELIQEIQPRLTVNPFISNYNQARAIISGKYEW